MFASFLIYYWAQLIYITNEALQKPNTRRHESVQKARKLFPETCPAKLDLSINHHFCIQLPFFFTIVTNYAGQINIKSMELYLPCTFFTSISNRITLNTSNLIILLQGRTQYTSTQVYIYTNNIKQYKYVNFTYTINKYICVNHAHVK